MPAQPAIRRNPWAWVISAYLAEGLPYVVVMQVAVIMYKRFGVANPALTNTVIAYYTGWLYLPWVLKPLWSPVVDILKTRRAWIWGMQLIIGGGMAGLALVLPGERMFQYSMAFFWLLAFSSATQDIAIDGFYLLATTEKEQAFFVGIRTTVYRVSMIMGQGALVFLAGQIEKSSGNLPLAWGVAFGLVAGLFVFLGIFHAFVLPRPPGDKPGNFRSLTIFWEDFFRTFGAFFGKEKIGCLLLFLLFYRFAEAQLVKMVAPFLLDPRDKGGLGLTTTQLSIVYGTVGIVALTCGGLLGGILASRNGLKAWLWWMVVAIHLPDLVFVYLAYALPHNYVLINVCVAVEQFGYGFGFSAYMLYMIYIARGEHATAHYAICTGFMALGMMVPGMFSGWLEDHIGYQHFFLWVLLATIPGFLVVKLIPLDAEFGKRAGG
jgi:MFS transporter, PAT family, beta-lactamase induction signal transducer AmpG